MKKALLVSMIALASNAALGADIYCGANVEEVPGSQVYNKLMFWEKMDSAEPLSYFFLNDGTVLKSKDLSPENIEKIKTGNIVVGVSFQTEDKKPNVYIAKVKRDRKGGIQFEQAALASALSLDEVFLVAHHTAMACNKN